MMSWLPKDQTTITIQQDIYDMARALEDNNIPLSVVQCILIYHYEWYSGD